MKKALELLKGVEQDEELPDGLAETAEDLASADVMNHPVRHTTHCNMDNKSSCHSSSNHKSNKTNTCNSLAAAREHLPPPSPRQVETFISSTTTVQPPRSHPLPTICRSPPPPTPTCQRYSRVFEGS